MFSILSALARPGGCRFQLDPGDVVITYTDGVIEAANQSGEEWGVQGLLSVLGEKNRQAGSDLSLKKSFSGM
jgi:serine phosphatase RsbU (regulator of sigma subunit)